MIPDRSNPVSTSLAAVQFVPTDESPVEEKMSSVCVNSTHRESHADNRPYGPPTGNEPCPPVEDPATSHAPDQVPPTGPR